MADEIMQEVESLEAIYEDGVTATTNDEGCVSVLFDSGRLFSEDELVRVKVVMTCNPKTYPKQGPKISFREPKGITDKELLAIQTRLAEEAELYQGEPMLFQLFDVVRSELEGFIPTEPCVICWDPFDPERPEEVYRTPQCFHFFHKVCMAKLCRHHEDDHSEEDRHNSNHHTDNDQQLLCCPVCRIELPGALDEIREIPIPAEHDDSGVGDGPLPTEFMEQLREAQQQRYLIYERQRDRGCLVRNKDDDEDDDVFHLSRRFNEHGVETSPPVQPQSQPQSSVQQPSSVHVLDLKEPQPHQKQKNGLSNVAQGCSVQRAAGNRSTSAHQNRKQKQKNNDNHEYFETLESEEGGKIRWRGNGLGGRSAHRGARGRGQGRGQGRGGKGPGRQEISDKNETTGRRGVRGGARGRWKNRGNGSQQGNY